MYSFEQIKQLLKDFSFEEEFDIIIAVAQGGIIPAAMLSQRLSKPIGTIRIHLRDNNQKPLYGHPILVEPFVYNVKDKRVLLVEDRVKSGASLSLAKSILIDHGAHCVKTFAVNGPADYSLLNVPCFRFPWLF